MLLRILKSIANASEPGSRIADRYANVPVFDQFGRRHMFRESFVDHRAVIVNSMYTTCRGTCPATSARLMALRRILSPLFGSRLSIVSFSREPETDTPARLRQFAGIYGANDHSAGKCPWHFVTGKPADIESLRRSLGFFDLNPKVDADVSQHGTLLLFGNGETDRWASLSAEMTEATLVESIRRFAGFTFEQRYGIPG